MTQLCTACDHMDAKSKDKWDKVFEVWAAHLNAGNDEPAIVEFDAYKPYCMEHPRQPVTDPVAGTHLDGPPYLRCHEVRKRWPVTCPWFTERKET